MSMAALIREMSAAGAPAEAIAIAVEAIEAAQAKVEEKRAAERDRKRRQRDRERDSHGTVTGQSGDVTDDPALSLPPNENISNPPTHTHPDVNTARTRNDPFPRPDWCSAQLWLDLKANRKAKRLACTPTAHAKLLRDLDAMADDDWPPGRLLEAIVARGWAAAAHDPRENRPNGHSPRRTDLLPSADAARGERRNRCLDMVLAAEAEIRAEENREPGWQAGPALRAIGQG